MTAKPLTVAILAMPGVQLLDVSGPLDVFAEANIQAGTTAYTMHVVATMPGPIASSSGVRLLPDVLVGEGSDKPIDTLLIAGAPHLHHAARDQDLAEWVKATAQRSRRYGSICSGAFLLGEAGLLDGRRATTHWSVADQLASRFPGMVLDADAIHVRDGKLRTAAGVTAGLDLALALVEEDLGQEIARKVASQLVMFFRRRGGQLQFSRKGEGRPAGLSALQDVQRWAAAHLSGDLSVAALAGHAGMSPRHFARLFQQETGTTPGAWVTEVRVDAARQLLEQGAMTPQQVAGACGFSHVDVMRRLFVEHIGLTPAEYRRHHAA